MLKIVFIFPDIGWNSVNFSPAILCLSAYLKAHIEDIDINVLHLNEFCGMSYDLDNICNYIINYEPDIVGVTSTSYTYREVNDIAESLKTRGLAVPVVLGGAHAHTSPDDIETSHFDAFAIGEGEISLLELCQRLIRGDDISNTPGFYYKSKQGVLRNKPAKALSNLDDLPIRDYNQMNTDEILKRRNGWLNIAFSRGCPYSCSFCINQIQRKLFRAGNDCSYFRCQSVEKTMSELMALVNQFRGSLKVINFDDDLLMLRKDWFISFANAFRDKIYLPEGIRYVVNGRADLIDDEIVDALSRSGCFEMQIGFESGDSELRNIVLNKQIDDDDLLRIFSMCRDKNVRTLAYTMMGIPGETHKTIEKTIKMLTVLKPTLIRMTIFDPFVGTPLHEYCLKNNLIRHDKRLQNHFTESRLAFADLSNFDIASYHLLFPWHLNIALGNEPEDYHKLLAEHSGLSFEDLIHPDFRAKVIAHDGMQSEKMRNNGISHFRYFDRNPFYYEYWSSN